MTSSYGKIKKGNKIIPDSLVDSVRKEDKDKGLEGLVNATNKVSNFYFGKPFNQLTIKQRDFVKDKLYRIKRRL